MIFLKIFNAADSTDYLILPTTLPLETLQHVHHKYYRKLAMGNTMHPVLAYTYAFLLSKSEI